MCIRDSLVHLVDISGIEGRNPIEDFNLINEELKLYNEKLSQKPMIIALNKSDLDFNNNTEDFINKFSDKYQIFKISAATTSGIKELVDAISELLATSNIKEFDPMEEVDSNFLENFYDKEIEFDLNFRKENDIYVVDGRRVDNLLDKVDLEDYDGKMYFEKTLREMEVFDKLKEMGIQEGDSVAFGDLVFEYYE